MNDWKQALVHPNESIINVVKIIDHSLAKIALVVNEQAILVGTVTDGDIRRAILRGVSLEKAVSEIMYTNYTVAREFDTPSDILAVMKKKLLRQIPIVDDAGVVTSIVLLDELLHAQMKSNWVVLMAGGLGSRLSSLTEECPKPLLKIGNKPILETIIRNFAEQGFQKFFISINYKGRMIEEYFGNGSDFGVDIQYLRETKKMGTAGALSLLPERPQEPMFVMNGDILTKISFQYLLDFHLQQNSHATMCVRDYTIQVPYGVVNFDRHRLLEIVEKPVHQFFVSAGVYLLEPDTLDYIPVDSCFDMPDFFRLLIQNNVNSSVFPIREYWLDIGRKSDFDQALLEYEEVFG